MVLTTWLTSRDVRRVATQRGPGARLEAGVCAELGHQVGHPALHRAAHAQLPGDRLVSETGQQRRHQLVLPGDRRSPAGRRLSPCYPSANSLASATNPAAGS
jgi:hypothetical protein